LHSNQLGTPTQSLGSGQPLSQDISHAKLSPFVRRNPGLVPISSLVTDSSEYVTYAVDLVQTHHSIPSPEEEKSQYLVPWKKIDARHHLPTVSSPMPFGTASFGGAILADAGVRGPNKERIAQLLHFCMISKSYKPDQ
jgi:hypothetical protein